PTTETLNTPCFRALTIEEMRQTTDGSIEWLWQGYLARRNVSLLTSQWHAGKTTLVSVLLGRMASGGTLAGRLVRPGRAVVISEEDRPLWVARDDALGCGKAARFLCRPFPSKPTAAEWEKLIGELEDEIRSGLDLVVIDPLAAFVPGDENNAGSMK